jgi:hypothetical protein
MHLCQFAKPAQSGLQYWFAAWTVCSLGFASELAAAKTPPSLDFDVPFTIGCRSLSLKEHAREGAFDLIEVVIPISARLRAGSERDLKQCVYTLVDPGTPEKLVVTDWLPRTELKTDYAKPIQFSSERLGKIGISLAAHYVIGATGDASGQLKSGVVYEMLPPQETVLASGTVQYGHGVFFKLRPSTQTTLEGKRSFSAIFAVPRGWRGGCLRLYCQAVGVERGIVPNLDREVPSGLAAFYMALYLAGDEQAESVAERLGVHEQELLDALAQYRAATAASHRPFSWSNWKWPKFGDKSVWAADTLPTEESLFNYLLAAPARPVKAMETFPAAVQTRFQALQQAAVTLEALSVGTPTAAPSFTGSRASFFAPPAEQTSTESVKPLSSRVQTNAAGVKPRELDDDHSSQKSKPCSPAQTKTDKSLSLSSTAPCTARDPQLRGGQSQVRQVPRETHIGNQQARVELVETAKSADPLSREAWYLLASMWGAVFTYIVAPLVVHFITNRKEYAREHSSAGARV